MSPTRYPQFCALARAAELLGERWTLLIVRELLLAPKRFTDLREHLDGVSTSVLTERLNRMEEAGLIAQRTLDPPAASSVYELAGHGAALRPVVFELIRWGARFLFPPRAGERFEPDWLRLVLAAYARQRRSPRKSFELRIGDGVRRTAIHVAGGARGTSVTTNGEPVDVVIIIADPRLLLGLMSGALDPLDALRQGRIQAEGDLTALPVFPQLFEVSAGEGGKRVGA